MDKSKYVITGAMLSEDEVYRYSLMRIWEPELPKALFIGLNPSTADAELDDPTIRRCVGFADSWGCGGIEMVNLFAFRATNPADMKKAPDPVGPHNDETIIQMAVEWEPKYVIAAWGAHGGWWRRNIEVLNLLGQRNVEVTVLGETKAGHPKHPLYLPKILKPYKWSPNG